MIESTTNGVTTLTTKTITYDIDSECPDCGRPMVYRQDGEHTWCGTGDDCGRQQPTDSSCWTCRRDMEYLLRADG